MVYLTRKAEFSASHYYHNPDFTPEENQRIFGKCNNPNGHGHNYTLEVTLKGDVNPRSGFVVDLKQLKEILNREVRCHGPSLPQQRSAGVCQSHSNHGESCHHDLATPCAEIESCTASPCTCLR